MDTICIVNGFLNRVLSVKILMFLSTPVYMRMVSGENKRFVLLTYKTILGLCFFMFGNWFIVPYCMFIGLLNETFYGNRGIVIIPRNLMQPL
uniref:MptD family putative ECF transporter S component n=1 Tax=Enterocloster clostridioformis TaxID=1531 RepID=UPI00266CEEC9|nr:MptD family putative ECF transporter S component [Enterocloster clostridioformis]